MVIIIVNRKNDYMSFFDVDDDVLFFELPSIHFPCMISSI